MIIKMIIKKISKLFPIKWRAFIINLSVSDSNYNILNKELFKYKYYLKPIGTDFKKINIMRINKFGNLAKKIINEKKTFMKEDRLYIIWQAINQTTNIEGDIVEVGVFRGGSTKFMLESINQTNLKNKEMYIFDTFEGMPDNIIKEDKRGKGDFSDTNYEEVKRYLSIYRNITIYKGKFEHNYEYINEKRFSMVHIDVDIYQSAKFCLNFFNSRISQGGIIILDDYGFKTCPGISIALNEFLSVNYNNYIFFHIETGQGILIKLK